MDIRVESYAGHRGMPMPRRFRLGRRHIEVLETVDQWYGPDYRYVKVKGDDGNLYILRLSETDAVWQLTMFESARAQTVATPLRTRRRNKRGNDS